MDEKIKIIDTILTTDKVPKYIKEIAKRLTPKLIEYNDEEGDFWGYTFKLKAKWKCGFESQLEKDTEALLKWCRRRGACAKLIRYAMWYNSVPVDDPLDRGSKYHLRKALKQGWHNKAYVVITDPVAQRFEKDNFYKEVPKPEVRKPVYL